MEYFVRYSRIENKMSMGKKLDLIIYPPVQVCISIFISFICMYLWVKIFNDFHPDHRWRQFTLLYAIIAISASSIMSSLLLKYPSKYIEFTTIAINSTSFSLVTLFLVIGRLPYHRPDIIIYFFVSTVVFFCSSWLFKRKRKYIFLQLPIGKKIEFRSSPNVRVFGHKIRTATALKKSLLLKIDGIIIDFSLDIPNKWQLFIGNACVNGARIYDRSDIIERIDGYVPYENFIHIVGQWKFTSELYLYLKRFIDLTLSVILAPVFLPIIIISLILIKIDSPGPGLFIQKRVGRYGRVFKIYKLRTMFHEDSIIPIINAHDQDPRITRIGRALRKYRIDEFPQLFNVLLGDMSWIGPRPETDELTKKYVNEIPLYSYRNVVRPGISGWAAINQGYVGSVSETIHKLNYDLFYIKNISLELDLLIFIKTINVILTGFGSK